MQDCQPVQPPRAPTCSDVCMPSGHHPLPSWVNKWANSRLPIASLVRQPHIQIAYNPHPGRLRPSPRFLSHLHILLPHTCWQASSIVSLSLNGLLESNSSFLLHSQTSEAFRSVSALRPRRSYQCSTSAAPPSHCFRLLLAQPQQVLPSRAMAT